MDGVADGDDGRRGIDLERVVVLVEVIAGEFEAVTAAGERQDEEDGGEDGPGGQPVRPGPGRADVLPEA